MAVGLTSWRCRRSSLHDYDEWDGTELPRRGFERGDIQLAHLQHRLQCGL
jgi:hypothetical protein